MFELGCDALDLDVELQSEVLVLLEAEGFDEDSDSMPPTRVELQKKIKLLPSSLSKILRLALGSLSWRSLETYGVGSCLWFWSTAFFFFGKTG